MTPLTLWVRIPLRRGVLDTTLCDSLSVLRFPSPIKLTGMIYCKFRNYYDVFINAKKCDKTSVALIKIHIFILRCIKCSIRTLAGITLIITRILDSRQGFAIISARINFWTYSNWNIVDSGVKHHKPKNLQEHQLIHRKGFISLAITHSNSINGWRDL
jgi:hypothetical protein